MSLAPVHHQIDTHLDEHIALLQDFVRQPSVSVDGTGVRECSELVAEHYRNLGCQEVEVIETDAFPIVWAFYDAGASKTLVNYNMYDERSIGDPTNWTHDPFGGVVEPRGDLPAVMYGRGALAPKGADIAWLSALGAIKKAHGELPVNIAFLAEGSEIIGSPSYSSAIDRYAHRLANADGCLYLRAAQDANGDLPLFLGYKTFVTLELTATGLAWGRGPANSPAHSAARSIVDSPALRLVQALEKLFTAEGDINVPQWTDALQTANVPASEQELVSSLQQGLGNREWTDAIPGLLNTGLKTFAHDLSGGDVLVRYLYGSSLNIQGIYTGYIGPGSRTYTIPHTASALLDARLLTAQSTDELVVGLRNYLDAAGFSDIALTIKGAHPGSTTALDAPLVRSFLSAAKRAGANPIIWPRSGGGGPWSLFNRRFGTPIVFGSGIGTGGNAGGPDEYLVIDGGGRQPGLREMEHFCVDLITDFATRT